MHDYVDSHSYSDYYLTDTLETCKTILVRSFSLYESERSRGVPATLPLFLTSATAFPSLPPSRPLKPPQPLRNPHRPPLRPLPRLPVMLSALTSLPISALSATSNFFTSRRRGFAYAAATVGTAYVAGKWALGRLGESQEQARKDGWGRDECVSLALSAVLCCTTLPPGSRTDSVLE